MTGRNNRKKVEFSIDEKGCFNCISHHVNKSGYAVMSEKNSKILVHRFIYRECFGELPEVVRHTCDNTLCINPAHLIGGTQLENIQDRVERNRSVKGSNVTISVLTENQVKEIRKLLPSMNNVSIAKSFGVGVNTIRDIRIGKTWRHVKV